MQSRVALRTPATTFFPGQGSATLPAPTQKAGLTGRIGLKRNGFQSAGRWRRMAEVPGSNCRVADRRNKHSGRAVQRRSPAQEPGAQAMSSDNDEAEISSESRKPGGAPDGPAAARTSRRSEAPARD